MYRRNQGNSDRRMYGYFRCPQCDKRWESGNAYRSSGQICRHCDNEEFIKPERVVSKSFSCFFFASWHLSLQTATCNWAAHVLILIYVEAYFHLSIIRSRFNPAIRTSTTPAKLMNPAYAKDAVPENLAEGQTDSKDC